MESQIQNKSIWSDTGKLGLKAIQSFLLTIFLFGFLNTIALGVSIYTLHNLSMYGIGIVAVIIVGILFTVLGYNFTLKSVIISGLKLIYDRLETFFRKLCSLIVDRVTDTATDVAHLNNGHIEKAFNIGDIFYNIYGRNIPRFIQWIIKFVLKRIPFVSILTDMKDVLKSEDKEEASELLFKNVDSYIRNSILESNSMMWLCWVLPINAIVQTGIICAFHYFMK